MLIWIGLGALALLILLLSRSSFQIRSEILIEAPPEAVWAAIVQVGAYRDWNTQLAHLAGEAVPGGTLLLRLGAAGAKSYTFKAKVSHWQAPEVFAWLARTGGIPKLFDGQHFFELSSPVEGRTHLVNREVYSGVLSMLIQRLPMMAGAPAGFDKMNAELKAYVEARQNG